MVGSQSRHRKLIIAVTQIMVGQITWNVTKIEIFGKNLISTAVNVSPVGIFGKMSHFPNPNHDVSFNQLNRLLWIHRMAWGCVTFIIIKWQFYIFHRNFIYFLGNFKFQFWTLNIGAKRNEFCLLNILSVQKKCYGQYTVNFKYYA